MDDLIKLLFRKNMVNKERWQAAATDTKQLLSAHLVPALGQVAKEADNMHDWMIRERAAFAQTQLHQLPTYCTQGEALVSPFLLSQLQGMHVWSQR